MSMNYSQQPPRIRPCPECGGERVYAQGGGYMAMAYKRTSRSPKFALGGPDLGLNALVCTNCGYTAFYVRDPSAFKD